MDSSPKKFKLAHDLPNLKSS